MNNFKFQFEFTLKMLLSDIGDFLDNKVDDRIYRIADKCRLLDVQTLKFINF